MIVLISELNKKDVFNVIVVMLQMKITSVYKVKKIFQIQIVMNLKMEFVLNVHLDFILIVLEFAQKFQINVRITILKIKNVYNAMLVMLQLMINVNNQRKTLQINFVKDGKIVHVFNVLKGLFLLIKITVNQLIHYVKLIILIMEHVLVVIQDLVLIMMNVKLQLHYLQIQIVNSIMDKFVFNVLLDFLKIIKVIVRVLIHFAKLIVNIMELVLVVILDLKLKEILVLKIRMLQMILTVLIGLMEYVRNVHLVHSLDQMANVNQLIYYVKLMMKEMVHA